MENIYENGPSEIGYGAASLAMVMQLITERRNDIALSVKEVTPNLGWQIYAGGWLIIYLTKEIDNFIDYTLDRDNTEIGYLAGSLLTRISKGECPQWILKQIAAETYGKMSAIIEKAETERVPVMATPQIKRLNEDRKAVIGEVEDDDGNVNFDTPLHYTFDCIDLEMQEYIAEKLHDFIITSDGEVETEEERPRELNIYGFTAHVSDDSLWDELKKQFVENDFYDFGYTHENGGTRTFGVEGVHEGIMVGVRQLIDLAMKDNHTPEVTMSVAHGLELPSRLVSSHERSQHALESIS